MSLCAAVLVPINHFPPSLSPLPLPPFPPPLTPHPLPPSL
jgi:hypothetical protein